MITVDECASGTARCDAATTACVDTDDRAGYRCVCLDGTYTLVRVTGETEVSAAKKYIYCTLSPQSFGGRRSQI